MLKQLSFTQQKIKRQTESELNYETTQLKVGVCTKLVKQYIKCIGENEQYGDTT